MNKTVRQWFDYSIVVATVALLTGCANAAPLGPDRPAGAIAAGSNSADLLPEGCEKLNAPEGSELVFHVYATGVQIYRWNGTSWVFVAPSATLFADAAGNAKVGIHYAGPTWESTSGSKVVATVLDRCTPDASSIPWLSLKKVTTERPGVFEHVEFLQRVNTVGGNAPLDPGSVTGEEAKVAYTAEYFFYR